MASIMERIRLILRAEATDRLERTEDTERVVNQLIADAMVAYAKLREESATVFEGEGQARQRLDGLLDEAGRWHAVARRALLAGNEADARTALSREQSLKERIAMQQDLYDQAHEVADAFRRRLTELEDGISQLQAKAARIKAKEVAAQATETAGRVSSSANGQSESAQALRRAEELADRRLAEAEGLAEAERLAADPFAALETAGTAVVPATAGTGEVDAALAALRAQLEAEEDEA